MESSTTFLRALTIQNFRNLQDANLCFSPERNIFLGANGSGKTNLLEAIATVALGKSQRLNATDTTLIGPLAAHYHIATEGKIEQAVVTIGVGYSELEGKRILLNNQLVRAAELLRLFGVVWLAPEDSEIMSGGPESRRRFIDMHLSQAGVGYLDTFSAWRRALAQRNAHIRMYGVDFNGTPFDGSVTELGASVTGTRATFLSRIGDLARSLYFILSGGADLGVRYISSIAKNDGRDPGEISVEELSHLYRARLQSRCVAEHERRITLVGPHRDDVSFTVRGLPARTHASQGEWRSAVIALKLSVFSYLSEMVGRTPLLLLDEAFAELDESRQGALLDSFKAFGQVFVTAATPPSMTLGAGAKVFYISAGAVTEKA